MGVLEPEETSTRVCRECGYSEDEARAGSTCPEHGSALVREEVAAQFPQDELLGRTLSGKYAVLDVLGRGGMGFVYTAVQLPVGRRVAVKVIRFTPGQDNHEELRGRFFREARVMAQLGGPTTVRLYDYGEDDDVLFMVLERVAGPSLRQVLRQTGAMEPTRAVKIAVQVLDALEEAHDLGLVHRDIKPPNILLASGPGGVEIAKVLDFGVAKVLDQGDEEEELTRTGMAVGTPKYMAPEQVRRTSVGPQTDLYALGVVLYEMLSGQTPFHGRSGFDVMTAHVSEKPPPLQSGAGISNALSDVVMRSLEKDLAARFQTAADMRDALFDAIEATESTSPPRALAVAAPLPTPMPVVMGPETPISLTSPTYGEVTSPPEIVGGPSRSWLAVGAVVLTLGAAIVLAWALRSPELPPARALAQEPVVLVAVPATTTDAAVPDAAVPDVAVADAAVPDVAVAKAEPKKPWKRVAKPKPRPRLKSNPKRKPAAKPKPAPTPGLLLQPLE